MGSNLPPDILEAYRRTHYRVSVPESEFILRVDEPSDRLREILREHPEGGAAFITADNPGSVRISTEKNRSARQVLLLELEQKGLPFYLGVGEDPSGRWPGEESFLVLGIALEEAKTLANRFGQNALLWAGPDGTPHLMLLR